MIDKGLGDAHMGFRKLLTQLLDPQVVLPHLCHFQVCQTENGMIISGLGPAATYTAELLLSQNLRQHGWRCEHAIASHATHTPQPLYLSGNRRGSATDTHNTHS